MNQFARRLSLESLETRNLLAGNVLATVNSGDLIIRGDNLSNTVSLVRVGTGSFRVTGFASNGQATKINGGTAPASVRTQLASLVLGYSHRLREQRVINLAVGAGLTRDTPDFTLTMRMPFAL